MITDTFRKPTASEDARWYSIDEIKEILASNYAAFDIATSNTAIGYVLSNPHVNFECKRVPQGKVYRVVVK